MTLGLQEFAGEWTVSRSIEDHLQSQTGMFAGTAVFDDIGQDRLYYRESGQIQFPDTPVMQAERGYLWWFVWGRVVVMFEDGSPFHEFVPAGYAVGTDHPCGDDHYSVRYDFRDWPRWQARWRVTGPRKDYVSTTSYARR